MQPGLSYTVSEAKAPGRTLADEVLAEAGEKRSVRGRTQ